MKALFFVESPLQLLNAVEAINFFSIESFKIILRLSGAVRSDKQLLSILGLLGIEPKVVSIVKIKIEKRSIIDVLKMLFYCGRYIFFKIDFVFIGNVESGFLKRVKKQFSKPQIIYLDDGTKTLTLRGESVINEMTLFSIFDMPYKSIYLNTYTVLKRKVKKKSYVLQEAQILFLGQKLTELNILSKSKYVNIIKGFAKENFRKSITYVTHRGEDLTKLDEIRQIVNVDVVELDYPVELYAFYNKQVPFRAVSFYSTALYTMKIIYGIEAESIRIKVLDPVIQQNIDAVYSYFYENGIVESALSIK